MGKRLLALLLALVVGTTSAGQFPLSWTAPVARADGSPMSLSDIDGYKAHLGTTPGTYTEVVDITDGTATSATIGTTLDAVYYVAMTTYDTAGLESALSPELVKTATATIPLPAPGTWVTITGRVLYEGRNTPVCAMVLASGQHMFSCDGTGSYSLNIPLNGSSQYKLQVYADGFLPNTNTYDGNDLVHDVYLTHVSNVCP